ncbi:diaminopimelate decarboxylase family protein [Candidatus Omnitrophota bacterium]
MSLFLRLIKKIAFEFVRLVLKFIKLEQYISDPSIWGLSINEKDHLVIGDCDYDDLTKKYGTPLHVVNQSKLIANFSNFYNSFKTYDKEVEIYYSYKTNPVPGVLNILHQQGAGAEVISSFELWLAFKQGVSPDKIIYNGPYKSDESLRMAIDKQIKLINIDSFDEIEKISTIAKELGKVPQVGIRVCSDVGWVNQFGFKIKTGEAFQAYKKCVTHKHLKLCGIHVHLGTCLKDPLIYTVAIDTVLKFINEIKDKLGIEIEYLDLGGGFAVPTVKHLGESETRFCRWGGYGLPPPKLKDCPSIEAFAKNIVGHIDDRCKQFNLKKPILLLEPGRAITSSTQILLIKVSSIKRKHERTKVIIADGGTNIAFPVTWEYHEIFLANRMSQKREEFYSISGPICTPADKIYSCKLLPRIQKGDILAIMDAGAYFIPFSNNFSFPRPAIINTFQGKHYLLRQRETFEDIVKIS